MIDEVIVTARRRTEHGSGTPTWVAVASVRSVSTGGGGAGNGATSTPITSEPELLAVIAKLGSDDRIVLKVEGMPTIVIDGLNRGSFFEAAFQNVVGLLSAIADGRLQAALTRMSASTRELANDLIADMNAAVAEGRFIRFTNVNAIPNSPANALAGTLTTPKNDTENLDGDPSTTTYTQVYFNKALMDRQPTEERGLASSRNKLADSLAVHIIHELFHVVSNDAERRVELAPYGSTVEDQNVNHDDPYDRAAMELLRFLNKMRFDLTISSDSPPGSATSSGPGPDNLVVALQLGETASVDSGAGDDQVAIPLSNSFVDTGLGNDRLSIGSGQGRLMWFDPEGSDVLAFPGVASLDRLAIERFGLFVYIGVREIGQDNLSALELANVVIFKEGRGPDAVEVGGQSYGIDYILSLANSKPDFFFAPEITYQAPYYGGYVANLPGSDPNGDPVTYSVVTVDGVGLGSRWWFEGSALYTSLRYNIQDTRLSVVTVRVSDGRLSQDYPVTITWTPDPNSETHPY